MDGRIELNDGSKCENERGIQYLKQQTKLCDYLEIFKFSGSNRVSSRDVIGNAFSFKQVIILGFKRANSQDPWVLFLQSLCWKHN